MKVRKVIRIMSCGYKYGAPPTGAVFHLDCRTFDNPFYLDELRPLTGEDKPVQDYLESCAPVRKALSALATMIGAILPGHLISNKYHPDEIKLVFACQGGKHRSQFFARRAAQYIDELLAANPDWDCRIIVEHRDNGKE